jgi:DNA-binding CsgD family transcriptional regulator
MKAGLAGVQAPLRAGMTSRDTIPYLTNRSDESDWEALNVLIGRIYDSVLHPEQWNDTLAEITATLCPLSWESAFILWESNSPPKAKFVAASGLAAGVQEIYAAAYGGNNLWSQRLARFRNGSVVDSDEIATPDEINAMPLFRDFLQPWGIGRLMAVMLDRRGAERLGLILPGPSDRDLTLLKRGLRVLAPHIQRAMRISDRIASLELAEGAARVAADQSPFAVFSLDDHLMILSANSRAKAYESAGYISTANGKFSFTHVPSQKKLTDLARQYSSAGTAFLALGNSGAECPVLAAKIESQAAKRIGVTTAGASIIITLGSGPGETPVLEINRVAQWYGLTPAEARLAVALAAGSSLQDYAAERATSINAVRFLLKGIFRKTSTASQAQLLSTLAKLPVSAGH